jgi:hypothetical protein
MKLNLKFFISIITALAYMTTDGHIFCNLGPCVGGVFYYLGRYVSLIGPQDCSTKIKTAEYISSNTISKILKVR